MLEMSASNIEARHESSLHVFFNIVKHVLGEVLASVQNSCLKMSKIESWLSVNNFFLDTPINRSRGGSNLEIWETIPQDHTAQTNQLLAKFSPIQFNNWIETRVTTHKECGGG